MRTSRTPLRISLLGGGTDYLQWFSEHDGAILGTSINQFCYVVLHDGSSQHFFDLPNKSGLGSSSAYTVGLLRACTEFDQLTIAKLATTWEYDKMGGRVGYQDQYLCALGGFRLLRFNEHGVRDMAIDTEVVAPLEQYLMLFNTHQYRRASDVVAHQLAEIERNKVILSRLGNMPAEGLEVLKKGQYDLFGPMLAEAWELKKRLSKYVSTPEIDAIYDTALKAGATGGKLLGGGGGGFILFFAEPEKQEAIRKALGELTYTPFKFEWEGTKVIYHD